MREILFRGIRTDNGEWVYGSPVYVDEYVWFYYYDPEKWEIEYTLVNPETVGQYTGLNDKNGTKIFEGDVTKYKCLYHDEYYEIGFGYGSFNHRKIGKQKFGISFDDGEFGLGSGNMEVIGNIHDNPELLEVNIQRGIGSRIFQKTGFTITTLGIYVRNVQRNSRNLCSIFSTVTSLRHGD